MQYLHRIEELFAEDRWEWSEQKDGAFRFPSYEAAEKACEAHRYDDAKGKSHVPFALVVAAKDAPEPTLVVGSTAGPLAVRLPKSQKTIAERAAIGRKASHAHFVRKRAQRVAERPARPVVSPEEAFRNMEVRHPT